uniref:ATP synthase subunit a n=1 Tax=Gobiidae sp. TaxID=3040165 RepID=A0AA95Z501_9GOBI|nr:ATP synthase F0 subunit 6 [Gobiidae sp.]
MLAMNLFGQFISPVFLGIPLIGLSLLFPLMLFPNPTSRWLNNRTITVQTWSLSQTTSQLFTPINPPGHKWALLLTSLMLMLISINMLGLLPYTFTPTAQLSMNLGLALPLWLGTVITGLRNYPNATLGHLLPESTPVPLIPILIIIETISLFIRPIALGVRLTANLTAGHLIMQLIATGAFVLLPLIPPIAFITSIVLLLLTILEVGVAAIQAYVFILLVTLYLQENV